MLITVINSFLHYFETLKSISYGRKIVTLMHLEDTWFQDLLVAYKLRDVARTRFNFIYHGLVLAFDI